MCAIVEHPHLSLQQYTALPAWHYIGTKNKQLGKFLQNSYSIHRPENEHQEYCAASLRQR